MSALAARIAIATGAALVLTAATGAALPAQSLLARDHAGRTTGIAVAPTVPMFRLAVGERATYDVELKGHTVGTGSLEVLGVERVDGYATLHATLKASGGILFARVNDQLDSWFDPTRFFSRRFVQDQHELRHTRQKTYEIAPEQGISRETNSGDVDSLSTTEPLDEVSFLFYVRTLPLHVGDVDTIPRYFKRDHDVIIRVLRTEMITVPAGTFETVVIQPTIRNAGGLFGDRAKAEVYVSADSARTLIMMQSNVPLIGWLSFTLRRLGGDQ